MLGAPTAYALGLPDGTPRHYNFDFSSFDSSRVCGGGGGGDQKNRPTGELSQPPRGAVTRKEFIESLYRQLNVAGKAPYLCTPEQQKAVAAEALLAFSLNVGVYAEEGKLYSDAARGAANVAVGFTKAVALSK
jgi:hypothetical protein